MGKRIVICGADFSENCVYTKAGSTPAPVGLRWYIGNVGSDGTLDTYKNALRTNLLTINSTSVSIAMTVVDPTAFRAAQVAVALYNANRQFIVRIANQRLTETVNMSSYPSAKYAMFMLAGYQDDLTVVSTALAACTYEINGVNK